MSYSVALPHPSARAGRRHHRLAGAVLAVVIGVFGFALASSAIRHVQTASHSSVQEVSPLAAYPGPALEREWRYEPRGVEYEHMYRNPVNPRLDWIRQR